MYTEGRQAKREREMLGTCDCLHLWDGLGDQILASLHLASGSSICASIRADTGLILLCDCMYT
jgi:hypothetical protein